MDFICSLYRVQKELDTVCSIVGVSYTIDFEDSEARYPNHISIYTSLYIPAESHHSIMCLCLVSLKNHKSAQSLPNGIKLFVHYLLQHFTSHGFLALHP